MKYTDDRWDSFWLAHLLRLDIPQRAIDKKQKALSEYDPKRVIELAGVTITRESLADSGDR
jgi:hypothetical protein